MDPNSQTPAPAPAPAAPAADNTPAPAAPEAPVVPSTEPAAPAPAPKTMDPVDHSQPAAPGEPAAPEAPAPGETPDEQNTPAVEPDDLTDIVGDATPDEMAEAIRAKTEAGEELPTGVNPDGTIDPLVYAYENMPDIKVVGKEGNKGELKEYLIKTADDLPDDFKFANAKEQARFNSALAQNTQIATELTNDAKQFNATRTAESERRTILVSQKTELDSLIASGKLPEIKLKHTDPNFMQDPGAVRAKEVIDHMKTMNKEFADAGVNQTVTSVALALRDLEAREAIEARDNRMGTISSTRTSINAKISHGNNNAPAAPANNGQRVHRDVNAALKAARKNYGI